MQPKLFKERRESKRHEEVSGKSYKQLNFIRRISFQEDSLYFNCGYKIIKIKKQYDYNQFRLNLNNDPQLHKKSIS